MEIVAKGFGDPSVLEAVPGVARPPGRGEVAIAVRAAGVNARDFKIYGDRPYATARGQREPTFPLRLGVEAAGVVTAVGEDAAGPAGPIKVGDEVIAYRIAGAYGDAFTVPAAAVVPKPRRQSWEEAGAMMLAGTTAAHALASVRARPGQTVLVHGAGGGVGLAVVQLAALDGVEIVGTGGSGSFDALRRYGAEPVRYGEGLLDRVRRLAPRGIDAAIDLAGTEEAVAVSLAMVADRSRIATAVATDRSKEAGIPVIGGALGQDPAGVALREAARLRLTALVQAGAYDVVVTRTFPLVEAVAARRLLAQGGGGGRIVLVP